MFCKSKCCTLDFFASYFIKGMRSELKKRAENGKINFGKKEGKTTDYE